MKSKLAWLALLLVPVAAFAQTSSTGAGSAASRVLNGHLFLPSEVVDDPFTPTYLDESTGFGYASLRTSQVDTSGNVIGTSQFQLGALGQGFKFQLGVLDSWAIRLAASGTALSGINADSALIAGATVGYTLSTGATYSFMQGNLRMAGSLDLDYSPLYTFSPLAALLSTISTGKIDTSTLFSSSDAIRIRPAFLAAMGINSSLGLRGVIEYVQEFVTSPESSRNGAFDLGAALDVDLRALTAVPLGLLAGYKLTVPTSGDGWGHQLSLGVFYTGARNLGLGLETVLQLPAAPAGTSDFYVLLASLTLRYYWD